MHRIRLRSALALCLIAGIAGPSVADTPQGAELPDAAELTRWDARFRPGRYAIDEFDLDANGQPLQESVQQTERCLSASDLRQISRLPFLAATLWSCEPLRTVLKSDELRMAMRCAPDDGQSRPSLGVAAVNLSQSGRVETTLLKLIPDEADQPDVPMLAKGSSAQRLGDCTPPRAKHER